MSLYQQQLARIDRTTAFREKWGGVISPKYTEGANLSSNNFVGTATTQDVINTLINPQTQNRHYGSSQNLTTYLRERNWTPETAPTNWSAPVKQTVLRAEIAGLSQSLVQPPKIKTPRPNPRSPDIETIKTATVIDQPAQEIVTEQIQTPDYELSRHSPSTTTQTSAPASVLPSVAILIGAGVALAVVLKKTRGKK